MMTSRRHGLILTHMALHTAGFTPSVTNRQNERYDRERAERGDHWGST